MKSFLKIVTTVIVLGSIKVALAEDRKPSAPPVDLSKMVTLPASSFQMGYPNETPAAYGDVWFVDQQPQHAVTLSSYKLDISEVTVDDFALFLTYVGGATHFHADQPIEKVRDGYLPVKGTEHQAMRQVTWQAAADYCAWVGKRLPTESEWERAAAGTDRRPYPWGNTGLGCSTANYFTGSAACEKNPVDVMSHPAGNTPDGIADLAGNVAEWTADWYDTYPADPQVDPRGPTTGSLRAVRGGGFLDGSISVRTHARWGAPPAGRSDDVGFRCAWSHDEAVVYNRGPLTRPADIDRQPSPRPYAPVNPEPEVLADGLQSPGSMITLNGRWYFAENGRGRILTVDPQSLKKEEFVAGLSSAIRLATDGSEIFIADQGNGKIWRVTPGAQPILVAQGETNPSVIVAAGGEVYWATPSAVRAVKHPGGAVEDVATGLDGVSNLALSSRYLWISEAGTTHIEAARIARTPRWGGKVTTVANAVMWDDQTRATDLVVDEAHDKVFFALSQPSFPNVGRICEMPLNPASTMKCLSYSPPVIDRLVLGGDYLYWATRSTLSRVAKDGSGPFENPGKWTRPGGIIADAAQVVWTDAVGGRLLRVKF